MALNLFNPSIFTNLSYLPCSFLSNLLTPFCHLSLSSFSSVQSLSCVQLFVTPRTAASQASLSFTISESLLKLMSIDLVMPSNHLILCCPLLLLPPVPPSIRIFSSEFFASGGQSIRVSASASASPSMVIGF